MGVTFKPGQSGNPNGRPKLSKTKFRFDVAAILKEHGCNPFQILADIANDDSKSVHARVTAASELCSYVAPKLKSIEHTTDSEGAFTITLNMAGKDGN